MNFNEKKELCINLMESSDKSKKGSVDIKIKPLIDLINSYDNYVTTSSCSGRIVLLKRSTDSKKHESEWIYTTHDYADWNTIWELISCLKLDEKNVWFKMESPIFHVLCNGFDSAMNLVIKAKSAGFKYSGIFSTKNDTYMVEIMGCEKMESLIVSKEMLLVDKKFIEESVNFANDKLIKSHNNLEKLTNLIIGNN